MSTLKLKQGFTLIELLVVIAIIGILSAVVLTSLGSARTRANDAKVQAQVSGARAEMEILANGSTYTAQNCTDIEGRLGAGLTGADCVTNGTAWAFSAPLSGTGRVACSDSTGASKISSSAPAANTYVCP